MDIITILSKMSIHEFAGWSGGIFLSICGLPQAWKCYRMGNSDGLIMVVYIILVVWRNPIF